MQYHLAVMQLFSRKATPPPGSAHCAAMTGKHRRFDRKHLCSNEHLVQVSKASGDEMVEPWPEWVAACDKAKQAKQAKEEDDAREVKDDGAGYLWVEMSHSEYVSFQLSLDVQHELEHQQKLEKLEKAEKQELEEPERHLIELDEATGQLEKAEKQEPEEPQLHQV